jgi:hypothetical protein
VELISFTVMEKWKAQQKHLFENEENIFLTLRIVFDESI